MSIEYIGTQGATNPYELSPDSVAALIGSRERTDGEMILRESVVLGIGVGLCRKGLATREGHDIWVLTDKGRKEYDRLIDILNEDDYL